MIPEAGRESLPPFCGGIAGLMSYELGQSFERIPRPAIDDFKTPALLAGLFDWAIVWDHVAGTVRQYVLRLHNCKIQRQDRVAWIDERLSQGGNSILRTPALLLRFFGLSHPLRPVIRSNLHRRCILISRATSILRQWLGSLNTFEREISFRRTCRSDCPHRGRERRCSSMPASAPIILHRSAVF